MVHAWTVQYGIRIISEYCVWHYAYAGRRCAYAERRMAYAMQRIAYATQRSHTPVSERAIDKDGVTPDMERLRLVGSHPLAFEVAVSRAQSVEPRTQSSDSLRHLLKRVRQPTIRVPVANQSTLNVDSRTSVFEFETTQNEPPLSSAVERSAWRDHYGITQCWRGSAENWPRPIVAAWRRERARLDSEAQEAAMTDHPQQQ